MIKLVALFAGIVLCLLPCSQTATIPRVTRPSTAFTPSSLQPAEPAAAISSTHNLVQELSAWSDLSVLLRLATLFPDLVEAAASADPFLVFAPTNDAFLTVARVFLPDTPEDADTDAIVTALSSIFETLLAASPGLPGVKDVLTYHLVAGDFSEEDIVAAGNLLTVFGSHIGTKSYPRKISDIDPTVDSKRLGRQIKTTNGRVSFVDNVLIPFNVAETLSEAGVTLPLSTRKEGAGDLDTVFKPFRSLVDFVTARNDLTVLATLASSSELLLNVLSDSASLHVFAPTDRSFLALAKALVPEGSDVNLLPPDGETTVKEIAAFATRLAETWALLDGVPSLEQIVAYHVINTSMSFSELVGAGQQETLFEGEARIEVREGAVSDNDPDRGDAPLIASFASGNGFVSVIDDVLLPFSASAAIEGVAAALGNSVPAEETKAPIPSKEPEPPSKEPDSDAFLPPSLQPTAPAPAIPSTYNLVQELSAWSDLSVLLRLVATFPDLVEAAGSADPFLVFAPTNNAFLTVARVFLPDTPEDADTDTIVTALGGIFETLLEAAPSLPSVKDVLTYHLVSGDFSEESILESGNLETVLGQTLGTAQYPAKIEDVDPTVDSKRLGRQIVTSNGRVSFVDNVLIPFNVADALSNAGVTLPLAVRQGDESEKEMVFKPFRSLVDFVTSRTDLTVLATLAAGSELLLDVLSNSAALHVFAPTDRSFLELAGALIPEGSDAGLLPEEGEAALGNVPKIAAFARRLAETWALLEGVPSLEDIVAYHVLSTSKSYEDLVGSGRQVTLFDGDARIEVLDTGVKDDDGDRGDAPRIASFATGNGFVTVVDGVLLPFPASAAVAAVAEALNGGGLPPVSEEPVATIESDGTDPDDDDAVCFPGHATVQLDDGSRKRMDELDAGDNIAVSRDSHSPVYLFTHRLHEHTAKFVTIETDCDRSVTLTPSHYVYANGKLTSAGVVRVGEMLETDVGLCRVVMSTDVVGRGLFAPHTMHGDLMVNGVKVSSYSRAVEPRLAHWALGAVRGLVKMGIKEPLKGWFDEGAPRLAALLPKGYHRY